MQVVSATTLITLTKLSEKAYQPIYGSSPKVSFLVSVTGVRILWKSDPKIIFCLTLSDVWNPHVIQIAYSRSNPGFKGKQSWEVKQISSYAASSLSSSKGAANDLFFGKTGKRSNMKAWLREEKSSTPVTASMLLARIHSPASRGSPMTFQLPYHALQGQKDGGMLSVCYFISLKKRGKLDGRLPQKFCWNIISTRSFPRRKFRFQNFLRLGTACKLCFSLAPHHYCLQCYQSQKNLQNTGN